jgi:small subunit ribosomal protein S6
MPNRRYETLVLIHPDQGDVGAKELVARIRQIADQQGIAMSQLQEWGVRELAYLVGGQRRAYHLLLEYRATPQALAELERQLTLMEPVLRHLSVRQAENAPPAPVRSSYGGEAAPARAAEPAAEDSAGDDADAALAADGEGV